MSLDYNLNSGVVNVAEYYQYTDFLTHLPVTSSDKTLMALKGHLLVEQALRTYISKRVPHPGRLKDKQMSFANLIDFASSLEDDKNLEWIWQALKLLNTVRNKLAHNLAPMKVEENEAKFVSYVQKHDGEISVKENNIKLDYGQFPLAVFQLYDRLLSEPRTLVEAEPESRFVGALERGFKLIESLGGNDSSKGPKSRKK